jgi:hypothetical protein
VLHADLSEPPVHWSLVATIPYGAADDRLGFIPDGPTSPQPMVPFAFGVASDGSFWILDEVKRRVAHYTSDGRYLGAIGGLRFDRFHSHPRDLIVTADQPVVLELGRGLAGIVDVVGSDGRLRRTHVRSGSRPVQVSSLVQTSGSVVGYVSGRPFVGGTPHYRPRGIFRLGVPGSGAIDRVPGIPLGDGSFMRLNSPGFQDWELRYASGDRRWRRRIHVVVLGNGRSLPAVAGPATQAGLDHGIASYVMVSPGKPRDAERYGGGRWFLEFSDDGTPLVWERLPTPAFDDETQVRHVTAGPDGSIYLMQVDGTGASIYRR